MTNLTFLSSELVERILGGAAETMLVWPNDWDLIESVLK